MKILWYCSLFVALVFIPISLAGEHENHVTSQSLSDAFSSTGGESTGIAGADTPVAVSEADTAYVTGETTARPSSLDTAALKYKSAGAEGVKNFNPKGNGDFTVGSADKYSDPKTKLATATNIEKNGPKFSVQSASTMEHDGRSANEVNDVEITETPTGPEISIGSGQSIQDGDLRGTNFRGYQNINGVTTFSFVELLEIPDGLLTNVENYDGSAISFRIGAAKDVVNGCINARNVRNSDITITSNDVTIAPDEGESFDFSDCDFGQSAFTATSEDSSITIEKKKRATYEITDGTLICHSLESSDQVKADRATIQYGEVCFECATISPGGNYFYDDSNNIEKDWGAFIPVDAEDYKLCIRRDWAQQFSSADGVFDFFENKITLTKLVELLKYPFKDGTYASPLTNTLLHDFDDYTVTLVPDEEFTLINTIVTQPTGNNQNEENVLTQVSNFFHVKEKDIEEEIELLPQNHLLVHIDATLQRKHLTDPRVEKYGAILSILFSNSDAMINGPRNSIVFLVPSDPRIIPLVN